MDKFNIAIGLRFRILHEVFSFPSMIGCDTRHLSISSHGRGSELGDSEEVQLLHSFAAGQTLRVRGHLGENCIALTL